MMIIASSNGRIGMPAALNALQSGSVVDAVEAGIRLVEANPDDHTVGYNGYPNIVGDLELDASIMEGRSLMAGGVATMKGYPYAISVARQVMEKLPHVLLAGEGAERFAREIGSESREQMLTPEITAFWRRKLEQHLPAEILSTLDDQTALTEWVRLATDPERAYSTINFIARDDQGNLCSGVSTSGWAWKYPGRVGDSPITGAGNYADNRYGACACTGMGEMAIRASTAHSVVFYMKMGRSVKEAAVQAMHDLRDLGGPYIGVMNLIAMDKDGNHFGVTSMASRTYIMQTPAMNQPEEMPRHFVEIPPRWQRIS